MSRSEPTATAPRAGPAGGTSWPLATWVAPTVPTLTLWLLVLVGSHTSIADEERSGYLTAVALTVVVGLVGWLLTRSGRSRLRGTGVGLAAGAGVTALVLLVAIGT